MMPLIFYIIRLIIGFQTPTAIKASLDLNEEFEVLYESKECDMALQVFDSLIKKSVRILPEKRIKASHCYYLKGDTTKAKEQLAVLAGIKNSIQNSTVLNQSALLAAFKGDTLGAIILLKKAIQTENSNTFAKRNYEYLLKVYKPNKNQPPPPNKAPENNSDSDIGGTVAQSDEKVDDLKSTIPPKIDHEQAMQLLDAMRANEYNRAPILLGTKDDSTTFGNW